MKTPKNELTLQQMDKMIKANERKPLPDWFAILIFCLAFVVGASMFFIIRFLK